MREFTLNPPLKALVHACETVCVAECCGIGAFHFSPFHAASFLIRYDARVDVRLLDDIQRQLEELRVVSVELGKSGERLLIEEMNSSFNSEELQEFVRDVSSVLQRGVELVEAEVERAG